MSWFELKGIDVSYGDVQVLWNISLCLEEGEIVAVVGANGSGKSTLINTISGVKMHQRGEILFRSQEVHSLAPHQRVDLGLVQIPEGRRIFPYMTTLGNLEMGSFNSRARTKKAQTLQRVFSLFPILQERKDQMARTLSGGEQQMLAIGRALMSQPKMLMMDEPSLGLAPIMVKMVFETVKTINSQGTTVLLVEQNVKQSLELSRRAYTVENGRMVLEGSGAELLKNEHLRKAYLGI